MRIDAVARRVIVTSAAYYGLDESLIPDAEFDALCVRLHDEWDDLDRVMQWKLGDPHAIKASGFHIRMSLWDAGGLSEVLRRNNKLRYQIVGNWRPPSDELPEKDGFAWTAVSDIAWNKRKPIQ